MVVVLLFAGIAAPKGDYLNRVYLQATARWEPWEDLCSAGKASTLFYLTLAYLIACLENWNCAV